MAPPLIVCLSGTDWGPVRHRERHLMERLSRHTTIVFVNPPRAVRSREWPFRRRTQQVSSTLWVHEPFVMPGTQRSSLASEITYGWLAARLEQWRHQRQCLLWLCSPHGLPFIDLLKPDRVVYDVAHLHASSTGPESCHEREPWEIAALAALERQLLPRADMALCASEPLMDSVATRARRAFLVPNGCDWQGYIRSHPPVISTGSPRIGYVGALTPQFDVDLVASLARRRTDWTIELVEPNMSPGLKNQTRPTQSSIDASALEPLSNVLFTGKIPFEEVPAKMASFDVCVLPLRDTPWAYYCSPIEAFDYLAAGKPVVSSPIGQLEGWPGLIHFARSAEEFEAQIETALTERTSDRYSERRVFAARNSWDVRITQILSALARIDVDLAGETANRQLAA